MEKRSPLKDVPLRLPGQSLQDEINNLADRALEPALGAIFFTAIAFMEWMSFIMKWPPHPVVFTIMACIAWAYAIWKIIPMRKRIRTLKQAREGEKFVGQHLEKLRGQGYRIMHDVIGNGFNIDHVVIGITGVYTIETKTISKPAKGTCEVNYDGEQILVNGIAPDRNPVVQASAQANWLRGLIRDMIGKDLDVRPVVLYPGWFVQRQPKGVKVWVLNEEAFVKFLAHEKKVLDVQDAQFIEQAISMYVRNSGKAA